jgi:hypothetical protein
MRSIHTHTLLAPPPIQHYPPTWDDLTERRVPARCRASGVPEQGGQQVLMFQAMLMDPPSRGEMRVGAHMLLPYMKQQQQGCTRGECVFVFLRSEDEFQVKPAYGAHLTSHPDATKPLKIDQYPVRPGPMTLGP